MIVSIDDIKKLLINFIINQKGEERPFGKFEIKGSRISLTR